MTEKPDRSFAADARLRKRHAAERRFRRLGALAIWLALGFLLLLLVIIAVRGYGAFLRTELRLDITFSPDILGIETPADTEELARANYTGLVRAALREAFPDARSRRDKRALYRLLSVGAEYQLRDALIRDPGLIGQTRRFWLPAAADIDVVEKEGRLRDGTMTGRLSPRQIDWLKNLRDQGGIRLAFNTTFFTNADSRDPEMAGIKGALYGSILTLAVCFVVAFVLGVAAAIFLEELAPKNRWTDFIEVNINNLAAVPSIIFGLLGLAMFLNVFGLPRSASLVGGLVLALMTLPTIIIASRAAIRSVPPSIREAALALGASEIQTIFHHVVPLALPGILTGSIIGMARALGETAPLLMIGMIAFIVDPPSTVLDPATTLPVQVYLWADSPERAFVEKTAGAILVLLAFLVVMNLAAILLRQRHEQRW